jgi:arsenate reductase/ArsR family transcriptional regulator
MRDLELTLKAAGDPTRTRILKLLEGGGLCVCQVQAVLGLAPSTISKHLSVLKLAGLVEDRRDGKWIEYALCPQGRSPYARPLLAMLGPIDRDPIVVADRKRLREIKRIPLVELCILAPPPRTERALPRRNREWRGRVRARRTLEGRIASPPGRLTPPPEWRR